LLRETVVVSAAGSTNGVNVIKALRSQNEYDLRIIGIDADVYAAGLYLADEREVVPKVSDPAFRDHVLEMCKRYRAKMLMPTHSVELHFYSSNQRAFEEVGVRLMIPPIDVLETCDDKVKVASFFQQLGIKCPKHYEAGSTNDIPETCFPLFIKSRFGSGSSHARKINNRDELDFYLKRTPDPIVQEYIDGEEYTVNVISDYEHRVVCALPIKRLRVRGGLAVVAQVEANPTIARETVKIVEALGLIGPSNVQVIRHIGELIFLEVNPRFASGGMPLATAAGLNIPLLMVKLMLGEPIGEISIEDGKKMIRYYDAITC
jgi:carbamoyl-phosphate synthase large subunit